MNRELTPHCGMCHHHPTYHSGTPWMTAERRGFEQDQEKTCCNQEDFYCVGLGFFYTHRTQSGNATSFCLRRIAGDDLQGKNQQPSGVRVCARALCLWSVREWPDPQGWVFLPDPRGGGVLIAQVGKGKDVLKTRASLEGKHRIDCPAGRQRDGHRERAEGDSNWAGGLSNPTHTYSTHTHTHPDMGTGQYLLNPGDEI